MPTHAGQSVLRVTLAGAVAGLLPCVRGRYCGRTYSALLMVTSFDSHAFWSISGLYVDPKPYPANLSFPNLGEREMSELSGRLSKAGLTDTSFWYLYSYMPGARCDCCTTALRPENCASAADRTFLAAHGGGRNKCEVCQHSPSSLLAHLLSFGTCPSHL